MNMAAVDHQQRDQQDADGSDAARGTFSIVVLITTIACASFGMALAILAGADAVQFDALAAIPFLA